MSARSIPLPRLITSLREGYSPAALASDLVAGVTVGLIALPLAMAFAIASGLPPQNGIYCAIVAGFIISAFGGSRVQIGGPTGAFVVVVSGIVATYGIEGLFMVTMLAGVILVLRGVTGLGTAGILAPEALLAFRAPLAGPGGQVAAAGLLVPLSRETFVITGRGTIHEVPAIALRAFAGPEVRF